MRVWPRGGVVLFMHGFAQGPTAYARMLTQLAVEGDVLVVAPCPPFGATPDKQQVGREGERGARWVGERGGRRGEAHRRRGEGGLFMKGMRKGVRW